MLGQKTTLKRIEIIQCLLLDDNGIKLEINKRKITGIFQNTWRFWGKKKKHASGTFLVVQCLRLPTLNAGVTGLIPRRGANIPHAIHMV